MTVYFVAKENGTFVCGPYRDKKYAQEAANNYSDSWLWGNCHVEEKEIISTRYKAVKRTALDGKIWWVIWDNKNHCYSTRTDHGRYKRKEDAEYRINNPLY